MINHFYQAILNIPILIKHKISYFIIYTNFAIKYLKNKYTLVAILLQAYLEVFPTLHRSLTEGMNRVAWTSNKNLLEPKKKIKEIKNGKLYFFISLKIQTFKNNVQKI